jgi:hypothetical protein
MIKMTDAEYLAKPIIEEQNFIIENDLIQVTSPSTRYAEARRHIKLCKKSLIALYTGVIKMARERNIKISFCRHYRREINKMWDDYERCYAAANTLFERILTQVKVVEERGLHYGTSDDVELSKLQDLCNEYNKNFWRSATIAKMGHIRYELERHQESMRFPDNSNIVAIYL